MYHANWNSLGKHEIPEWFKDAKFGIFIHWGPFSVPAFGGDRTNNKESFGDGTWYSYWMYRKDSERYKHHLKNWGDPKDFGYKDFVPLFKGEKFDADQWISIFKSAGAKYVVPVADFHDGFAMFDCSFSGKWNAVQKGPERDVIGEIAAATRRSGLKFRASSHIAQNWYWYPYGKNLDTSDPDARDMYGVPHDLAETHSKNFLKNWDGRTKELVDKYDLDIIWFDFGWEKPAFDILRPEFASWFYNWAESKGKTVVLQSKGGFPTNTIVYDIERGGADVILPYFWQTDTSVSKKTWCYDIDDEYKTSKQIIDQLVDVVSKNGSLLLNVGPKPDGTFPEEQLNILRDIGSWLNVNGEAIYGTRPWYTFGEGDLTWVEVVKLDWPTGRSSGIGPFADADTPPKDSRIIRYTSKSNVLYAIIMGWPDSRKVSLRYLHSRSPYLEKDIRLVELLGTDKSPDWHRDEKGLHIKMVDKPDHDFAYVLKIALK